MGKQQLYIKGIAVDMPTEEIKIKVESNIFGEMNSIMTAHSYTITLPCTMTNDSIFNNAFVPSAVTAGKSTHKYLKCALYIDGIPLFDDGQCVLTAVEEKGYKCNLFWGLLSVFDEVKNEGLNLCDLPMSSRWNESTMGDNWYLMQKYMGDPNNITGMSLSIYNTLDSDSQALADKLPWSMPKRSATDIIAKIAQVYGLTLSTSYAASQRIAKIFHPLLSRKAMAKDETNKIRLGCYVVNPTSNQWYPQIWKPSVDISGQWVYSAWSDLSLGNAQSTNQNIANDVLDFEGSGVTMVIRAKSKCAIKSIHVYGKCDRMFKASCGLEEDASLVVQRAQLSGGYYTIDYTWENLTAEPQDVPIGIAVGSGAWWSAAPTTFDVHFDIVTEKIEDLEKGAWWDWIRNLPEMTVIDYLSEILAHIGGCIVGCVNKRDYLRIMTFDEILQASAQSYDMQGVKTITMAFDKLAQKNIYTHKDNEDTGINYTGEGVMYTNDETLAVDRKAFDSKFKVPRLALIRLWEVEKNDNANNYKAKWAAKGEYICGYDYDDEMLKNTGQDFATTISSYYVDYEAVMRVPKVIIANVRMSVLELLKFTFEKPVHIKQLGASYAVKTLEGEGGDNYKLTLVQI